MPYAIMSVPLDELSFQLQPLHLQPNYTQVVVPRTLPSRYIDIVLYQYRTLT